MVKVSADSLLSIINDNHDFSKIEAGKLELEALPFNLADNLSGLLRALGLRAQEKGLELIGHVEPDVPAAIVGDPHRLRQVLVNLVGNALKFTEQGEVVVDVRCLAREKDRVGLHFSVRDTGIGIPADKQQLIFEAFSQADCSTTRRFGGTGLGLSISKQLVAMMGGKMWLESEPGQGSTFHFSAYFGNAEAAAAGPPALPIKIQEMAVLVVDDNATNRRILEQTLKSWKMRPTLVDSGAEAVAALEAASKAGHPFPLVLLDVHMPQMDGFDVAARIHSNPRLVGATVLMLTSGARQGDIQRCRELGVSAYLMKPIAKADLRASIMQALRISLEKYGEQVITGQTPDPNQRPLHILLAEDHVVNQKLAIRLLNKQGHDVVLARNGKEALALHLREKFDLVLMDLQMPEMGGLEATASIRARERATGDHLPIIAMTAHAMKGDRERCLAAGMDDYIAKPVHATQLRETIARVVSGRTATAAKTTAGDQDEETLVDEAAVLDRCDGDRELLNELVDVFLDDCPRLLRDIRTALDGKDVASLKLAAHTLKGAAANFGARSAVSAALRLEMLAADRNLTDAPAAFEVLEKTMTRVNPAIARLRVQPVLS
jgi:CheY-like chemotaxis protein/HPt (histidine-containing phosphotransfer) domain-containing protein